MCSPLPAQTNDPLFMVLIEMELTMKGIRASLCHCPTNILQTVVLCNHHVIMGYLKMQCSFRNIQTRWLFSASGVKFAVLPMSGTDCIRQIKSNYSPFPGCRFVTWEMLHNSGCVNTLAGGPDMSLLYEQTEAVLILSF